MYQYNSDLGTIRALCRAYRLNASQPLVAESEWSEEDSRACYELMVQLYDLLETECQVTANYMEATEI